MADKNKNESIAAVAEPVAAAPVVDAFTRRCEILATFRDKQGSPTWDDTVAEIKARETERLAAKKQKAAVS